MSCGLSSVGLNGDIRLAPIELKWASRGMPCNIPPLDRLLHHSVIVNIRGNSYSYRWNEKPQAGILHRVEEVMPDASG